MWLTDKIVYWYASITPFQTAILVSFLILYTIYLFVRDLGVPPGPKGLPFLGYWPFLKAETLHVQLREMSKTYGDVFSFRVTGRLFIHLGSLKALREAHLTKTESFAGRFFSDSILSFIFYDGVAVVNGDRSKVLRKFFLSKFKEYGMNAVKENAASSVYDNLKETVEELRSTKGSPVQISDLLIMKCSMNLRRIMFNDEGMTVEELKEMIDMYGEMAKGMTGTNLILTGFFAKYFLFPLMPCSWTLKRCQNRLESIMHDVVKRHKSEYSESHIVDLIDCYFKERDERRSKGDPTAAYFTDKALVASISQFVTDGILSVGVFIGSFLAKLVEYPDIQQKLYQEILDVIGQDRLPTLEDKNRLPYTNAFIYEVIRFTDFFPIFPSLECSKETTVGGYRIPEGSITLVNVYAANRNPKDFENPDDFNPSRYMPKEGETRPELPIIFGVGKRSCIGESFTMVQTFLFLTIIIQNFRLSLPEGAQGSFVFWAQERLKICFHPRTHKTN